MYLPPDRAASNLAPPLPTAPLAPAALAAVAAATVSEVSLPADTAALADAPPAGGPQTLFGGFPRTLLLTGDAERLVREVRSLAQAMGEDGVDLSVHWARDACHTECVVVGPCGDRGVLERRGTVG